MASSRLAYNLAIVSIVGVVVLYSPYTAEVVALMMITIIPHTLCCQFLGFTKSIRRDYKLRLKYTRYATAHDRAWCHIHTAYLHQQRRSQFCILCRFGIITLYPPTTHTHTYTSKQTAQRSVCVIANIYFYHLPFAALFVPRAHRSSLVGVSYCYDLYFMREPE